MADVYLRARWDFIGRTRGMMHAVDPSFAGRAQRSPAWKDIQSRAGMGQMLIEDTTGKLDAMNAGAGYRDDGGVEFGSQILEAAKELGREA